MIDLKDLENEAGRRSAEALKEANYSPGGELGSCVKSALEAFSGAVLEAAYAKRDADWILAFVVALGYDRRYFAPTCPEGIASVLEHFRAVEREAARKSAEKPIEDKLLPALERFRAQVEREVVSRDESTRAFAAGATPGVKAAAREEILKRFPELELVLGALSPPCKHENLRGNDVATCADCGASGL